MTFEEFVAQDEPFMPTGEKRFLHCYVGYEDGESGHDLFFVDGDGTIIWYTRRIEHSMDVVREVIWYCDTQGLDPNDFEIYRWTMGE